MGWGEKLSTGRSRCGGNVGFGALLDRDAHVATIATLAAVALVLTDAAIGTDASILAPAAWALPVAALLAFTTALTTGLGGQVLFINTILSLEVDGGGGRGLARL